jgi:hypothetical protein
MVLPNRALHPTTLQNKQPESLKDDNSFLTKNSTSLTTPAAYCWTLTSERREQ